VFRAPEPLRAGGDLAACRSDVQHDPQALLAAHLASAEPDATALSADLIARIATYDRINARRLEQMSSTFRIGACLLAIQMLLTLVAATVTV